MMNDNSAFTKIDLNIFYVEEIIERALKEDVGPGDITTENIVPQDKIVSAYIMAKDEGIIAGLGIAELVFAKLNPNVSWISKYNDGDKVKHGDILAEIQGSFRTILTGERTALNFLQRMSGIATITRRYADAAKPYSARILDTRKTIPGLRLLDKYSVRVGGGTSHRAGLYDMIMVKDNHIKVAGGIRNAVEKVRSSFGYRYRIEVETTNLEEVREALETGVDIIMFDNMTIDMMKEAVGIIDKKVAIEASGNMTLDVINEVASCGVDYISVGALTHSVIAFDLGLYIKE